MIRRGRGAALVLAMLIAALVAAVVVALAAEQQRWLTDVGNRGDQVQAQSLALAGVQWARQILRNDAAAGTLDHLGEIWALPLPPTPIANGVIEGRIEDMQGRFNLNNLGLTTARAGVERARLARLLATQDIPAGALDAVADWIDADTLARPGGAEDAAYAALATPALAANAPMLRAAELGDVRGFSSAQVADLAGFVTALPPPTALNLNTAPPEVLSLAIPGLVGEALATVIAERASKPYATVADFASRLPRGIALPDQSSFTVTSHFFLVSVRSRQGEAVAQARALLRREGGRWPAVVWQTLE